MNQLNKQAAKVALVTGGARRIGAALVKTLHQAGYRVVIHCCTAHQEARALALTLNALRANSALVIETDLREQECFEEMMTRITNWTGRLDLLVNNASIFLRTACRKENKLVQWQDLFDINVKAPFLLSLAAYPLLRKQQGAIINITDIHADRALKGYSVYCQTKAALKMQTQSLAREFAPEVRVNAVAPGAIIWPEEDNVLDQKEQQKIIDQTPLKKHGSPEYIAQAVLALAQNSFVTGQSLKVDGGRSLT